MPPGRLKALACYTHDEIGERDDKSDLTAANVKKFLDLHCFKDCIIAGRWETADGRIEIGRYMAALTD